MYLNLFSLQGSPKAEAIGISSAGSQMEVGSLIRIPSYDITHPWRHGTIKWIGNLENIQGKIAGIELVRIHVLIVSYYHH